MKHFLKEVFRVARHIGVIEQIIKLFTAKDGGVE